MKNVLVILLVGLLLWSASAFGELTFEDVQKIRDILKPEFDAINKRFDDVNQRFNIVWMLLVALIVAVIGMPLYRERKKEREQDEEIKALKRIVEQQQVEIERLKTRLPPSAAPTP
ncbi:hypothetical protein C6495_01090 [Candidatus Poribacteria bacterium]|nr:MAG: hypothetical protein C6495_01090 [Candidatus Poribacteria bacterium]